jgi:hypothetical protein
MVNDIFSFSPLPAALHCPGGLRLFQMLILRFKYDDNALAVKFKDAVPSNHFAHIG